MFKHKILSVRATFSQIAREGKVDPVTNVLYFRGKEIGLIYFRTGYQIDQYDQKGEQDIVEKVDKWKVREMIECSMAIKCPSIDFQLTTFKKFQQALSSDILLE